MSITSRTIQYESDKGSYCYEAGSCCEKLMTMNVAIVGILLSLHVCNFPVNGV